VHGKGVKATACKSEVKMEAKSTLKSNPLGTVEVDTVSSDKKKNVLRFCTHVGWKGSLLLLGVLTLSIVLFLLFYIYSLKLTFPGRSWVWIFAVLSILYFVLFITKILFWRKIADAIIDTGTFTITKTKVLHHEENHVTSIISKIRNAYTSITPVGENFLFKTYLSGTMGCAVQCLNLATVYTCSLPIAVSIPMCILLGLSYLRAAWEMVQENTPERRTRQLLKDAFVDLMCMITAPAFLYFIYQVPIYTIDLLSLIIWPAMSMISLMDDILEDLIRHNVHVNFIDVEQETSQRRRGSIMKESTHFDLAKRQKEKIPKSVRFGFLVSRVMFSAFFLIVGFVHFLLHVEGNQVCATKPLGYTLWEGCQVKVPHCRSLFVRKCNCCVLKLNNHNITSLPHTFTDMNALKQVVINRGPLQDIPENIGSLLPMISDLNFDFNKILYIPSSIKDMKRLIWFDAAFNNISRVHDSFWHHSELTSVDLSSNIISTIPKSIAMASLSFLWLANNSISILPEDLFKLPNLVELGLSGNQVTTIPNSIGEAKLSLLRLTMGRNNLTKLSFPQTLKELTNLEIFDLRNNSISALPPTFEQLTSLNSQTGTLVISGNPICTNGWIHSSECPRVLRATLSKRRGGCTRQCSDFCIDRSLEENIGECFPECNSQDCSFSQGGCM
jgi:hypothetical protein